MLLVELRKLVRRPRTWVSIGLLAGLPTLVAIFLKVTGIGPRPGEGPAFLGAVLSNGALFPAAALALVLPLFLPVAVSVMAGDTVAGEANHGTLRYLLIRPVGRTRLLVAKLIVTIVFVFLAVVVVAAVALFLSTVTDSPLAAALGALAVLVTSTALLTLDAARALQPYLPTRYWLSFVDLFRQPILWRDVLRGVGLQAVYVVVLLGAAWANFTTKDVKS